MANLVDSYSGITSSQGVGTTSIDGNGQSFTGDGNYLSSVSFYLQRVGSPTGTATIKVYAHSGTYGSTGIPIDYQYTNLDIDVSTISTTAGWVDSPLGGNGITLINGERYVVTFEYDNNSGSDYIRVFCGNTSGSSGNRSQQAHGTGVWTSDGGFDLAFKVYTETLPLIGTLYDNFNDNSLDPAKWSGFGDVAESSGQLVLTADSSGTTTYVNSVNEHNFTGGYLSVDLVNAGNQALASLSSFPIIITSSVAGSGDEALWTIFGGDIYAIKETAVDGQTTIGSQVYSSVTHRYLRIRESSGTVYWDYSSDSQTWNNIGSSTGLNFSGCGISMILENGDISSSSMVIDDVNLFYASSSRLLYATGILGDSSSRSLYATGKSSSESSRGLYATGQVSSSSERGLYSTGIGTGTSERGLYATGALDSNSERPLYATGKTLGSSERGLYAYALLGSSSERGLYATGKVGTIGSTTFIDTEGSESGWIDTKGGSTTYADMTMESSDIAGTSVSGSDFADIATVTSDVIDINNGSSSHVDVSGASTSYTDTSWTPSDIVGLSAKSSDLSDNTTGSSNFIDN